MSLFSLLDDESSFSVPSLFTLLLFVLSAFEEFPTPSLVLAFPLLSSPLPLISKPELSLSSLRKSAGSTEKKCSLLGPNTFPVRISLLFLE